MTEDMQQRLRIFLENTQEADLRDMLLKLSEKSEDTAEEILAALRRLHGSGFAALKKTIGNTISENTWNTYVDYGGEYEVAAAFEKALLAADNSVAQKKLDNALEIILFVIEQCSEVIEYAESGMLLDDVLEKAVGFIEEIGRAAAASEKRALAFHILETAGNDRMDAETGLQMVRAAASLADQDTKTAFLDTIDMLSSFCTPTTAAQAEVSILEQTDGREAARAYRSAHLEIDEFREYAVEDALQRQAFDAAARLCEDRIKELQADPYPSVHRIREWNRKLHDVWKASGDAEKLLQHTLQMVGGGDTAYYEEARKLAEDAGVWTQEYPVLLEKVQQAADPGEYMRILSMEGETERLFAAVRKNPSMVFTYGKQLYQKKPAQVQAIVTQLLLEMSSSAGSRDYYRTLGGRLEAYAAFGAKEAALALLDKIKDSYPRRWALQEELSVYRQKILEAGGPA